LFKLEHAGVILLFVRRSKVVVFADGLDKARGGTERDKVVPLGRQAYWNVNSAA